MADASFAASRTGDLGALVALLDPDVVARADYGPAPAGVSRQVRGAHAVAEQAVMFSRLAPYVRPALVNGAAGAVVAPDGKLTTIMAFTIRNGKITEIDILADPARLRRLNPGPLHGR
jgi:RNA polymerase sigma-70 factor, ECF subfamily